MNDKLRAAHDKLQDAVAEIVSGDEWKRMLKVASKFHRYSFNNHLMIFLQRPDATVVAGFNRWKSLGRFVKKGEEGIAIFAPCKYRTKIETDDGEEKTLQQVRGFRVVHVFDISQTEGQDLPDLDAVRPKLLDADAPEGIWEALVAQADAAGFEVTRSRRGSENGYCDFVGKEIAVRPDVSAAQGVKTLIHELAHALLHSDELPRSKEIAEVEVESVAYIVCDAIGLDSGDYSFPYVARWAGNSTELLKETAERAIGCAKQILRSLEAGSTPSERLPERGTFQCCRPAYRVGDPADGPLHVCHTRDSAHPGRERPSEPWVHPPSAVRPGRERHEGRLEFFDPGTAEWNCQRGRVLHEQSFGVACPAAQVRK